MKNHVLHAPNPLLYKQVYCISLYGRNAQSQNPLNFMHGSIPSPEDAKQVLLGRSQVSLFEKIANLKTEIPGVFSSWAFAPSSGPSIGGAQNPILKDEKSANTRYPFQKTFHKENER